MKEFVNKAFLTVVTLCTIVLSFMSCRGEHNRAMKPNVDTVRVVEISPAEAVKLNLDIRHEMIEQAKRDSIYMNMPEQAIIYLSLNHPDWDIEQIVNEYVRKKDFFSDYMKMSKEVGEYTKKHGNNTNSPDTLPIKAKPDTPTKEPSGLGYI